MSTTQTDSDIAVKLEIIEYCIRLAKLLGQPKSVGEIFGLLFATSRPLSMDDIMEELRISLGTASQGLKTLRNLRAVRVEYLPGVRKDHFTAETDFRMILNSFVGEKVKPHLQDGESLVERASNSVKTSGRDKAFYEDRVKILKSVNKKAKTALGLVAPFI